MANHGWPETAKDLLRRHWPPGPLRLSCRELARLLTATVADRVYTVGSVTGQVDRTPELAHRPSPLRHNYRTGELHAAAETARRLAEAVAVEAQRIAAAAEARRLVPMVRHTCQYPHGHPRQPGFGFCGKPAWACEDPVRYDPSRSIDYCQTHYRICYTAAPRRLAA